MLEDIYQALSRPLFSLGETPISLTRILAFLAVVVLALWIARLAELSVRKLTSRREQYFSTSSAYALGRITRYALLVIGLIVGLSAIGFDITSLTILGGAIGIGVGLGLQEVISNFVSGVVLLVERSLKVGDFVELESGVRGNVVEIAMRYTRIHTNDAVDVLVPNSEFVNGRVTNWTFDERMRRMHVPFGVAYGSDKSEVRAAGLAAARRIEGILHDDERRKPDVWLVEFGDSSLNFELVVWVDHELATRPGRTQARLLWAIEDELRARKLEIPFPQRVLHLRSGVLHVARARATERQEPGPSSGS